LWREENRRTQRKTLGAKPDPTTNSTHIWHRAGIRPMPHWLEASALTTSLSLLPMLIQIKVYSRNFCWHKEKKRYNRRGIMTINNKSHFFEPLPEIPKEQQKKRKRVQM